MRGSSLLEGLIDLYSDSYRVNTALEFPSLLDQVALRWLSRSVDSALSLVLRFPWFLGIKRTLLILILCEHAELFE